MASIFIFVTLNKKPNVYLFIYFWKKIMIYVILAMGIQDSLKDGGEMSSEGEGEDTSNSAESYQLDSAESNAFQRRVNLSRANRALEEINNKLADAERAEGIAKAKLEEKKKVHGEAVDALNNDPDNLDLRAKEKRASADVDDAQGEYNKASKATDSLVDKSNENNSRREEILKTIKDSADQARHRKELRGRLNEINKELSPLLDERSAEELTKRVVDFAKKIIAKIGNRLKSTTVEKALADQISLREPSPGRALNAGANVVSLSANKAFFCGVLKFLDTID
jgi:chromosome segregation ATPase